MSLKLIPFFPTPPPLLKSIASLFLRLALHPIWSACQQTLLNSSSIHSSVNFLKNWSHFFTLLLKWHTLSIKSSVHSIAFVVIFFIDRPHFLPLLSFTLDTIHNKLILPQSSQVFLLYCYTCCFSTTVELSYASMSSSPKCHFSMNLHLPPSLLVIFFSIIT